MTDEQVHGTTRSANEGAGLAHGTADDDIKRITPADFASLDFSSVTLLDLREPDEVLVHGIEGAINIPFEQIGKRLGQVPNDKPVIVFCRVGDWSEQVTEILADRGYDAINLDGGFQAYRDYLRAHGNNNGDTAAPSSARTSSSTHVSNDVHTSNSASVSGATITIPTAAQQLSVGSTSVGSANAASATADRVNESSANNSRVNTIADGADSTVSTDSAVSAVETPAATRVFVDAKGLKCPGPIVKVADTLRPLPIGTRLTAEATEDAFLSDIAIWCERTGNRLVDLNRSEDGVIHVVIDKLAEMPQLGSSAAVCPSGIGVKASVAANGQASVGQTGTAGHAGVAGQASSIGQAGVACQSGTTAQEQTLAVNPDGGDIRHDKTFVVFSGDLDKTIAVFIMANGAAAMGRKVTIFFTFWGLNILRKPKHVRVRKSLIEHMFGMMMPRGTKKLGLSRMNMGGIGAKMIRWIMKSKNVESLESLMQQAVDHGVRLVACQMSMDIMGIRKEELIDGVELGGVSTFLGSGETSDMSLFV